MKIISSHIPYVPLRKEPGHHSEQVSQLLFGENAEILESRGDWVYVKMRFDNYKGWLEKDSVQEIQEEDSLKKRLIVSVPSLTIELGSIKYRIPAGSEIPLPIENGHFQFLNKKFSILDPYTHEYTDRIKKILELSIEFTAIPYLWGGRSIMGIDCSGLVQIIFKAHGINLPRDASQQATKGNIVESISRSKKADLFFFSELEKQNISHVGIYLGANRLIHASKFVRIDQIDEKGIYNTELKKYTHQLRSISRIL